MKNSDDIIVLLVGLVALLLNLVFYGGIVYILYLLVLALLKYIGG